MSNELGQTEETVIINGVRIPVAFLELAGFKREVKQGGRLYPKNDELYFYYYADGELEETSQTAHVGDLGRYLMGNCYRTKEEAEAARDKQLALVRVQDKLEELTDELLDWSDISQNKSVLFYCWEDGCFDAYSVTRSQCVDGLYGSLKACNWVIDNMESDLKLIAGIA